MPLQPHQRTALSRLRTIDFTTYGRTSGRPSRIEIWWFYVDGRFVITGTPGPRDWLANVRANPAVVVHANGDDHEAEAFEITDEDFRRAVFTHPEAQWFKTQTELERLIATSPIIELVF